MSVYYPEGVDMRRAGIDDDQYDEHVTVYGVQPLIDPLLASPCSTHSKAAEHVAQHVDAAHHEPDTWEIQWHAACIEMHPYQISREDFRELFEGYFPEDGVFYSQEHLEDFLWIVGTKIEEVKYG